MPGYDISIANLKGRQLGLAKGNQKTKKQITNTGGNLRNGASEY